MANQRPICIVDSDGEDSFTLKDKELKAILSDQKVKDRPVCIISIAGAYRQGKSFFLNFLLKYLNLKYIETSEEDFLNDNSGPLRGFSWKFGRNRDTVGILMWSEVFLAETASGKEIAIIVLDTQGSFDNESTYGNCATIFALSTLMSSVQIYNVMGNIKSDDLEHLRCFAEYGKFVKKDKTPFQKLLFLVRDWAWNDDGNKYGLQGGRKLLREVLNTDGYDEDEDDDDDDRSSRDKLPKEIISRRKNVKALFSRIECFLMPRPGDAVCRKRDFEGRIEDIDEEFLKHMSNLIPHIAAPDKLLVKRIDGNEIKAGEVIYYLKAFLDRFQDGEVPKIKSVYMATVEANHLSAIDAAKQLFRAHIEQGLQNSAYLEETELKELSDAATKTVTDFYKNKDKIGSKDSKINAKYNEILKTGLAELLKEYKEINERNRVKEITRITELQDIALKNSTKEYEEYMNTMLASVSSLEDNELHKHHADGEKKAAEALNDALQGAPPNLSKESLDQLKKKINEKLENYQKKNQEKRENDVKISNLQCENLATKSHELYQTDMDYRNDLTAALDEETLNKRHEEVKKAALTLFREGTSNSSEDVSLQFLKSLEEKINNSFESIKSFNEKKLEKLHVELKVKYENALSKSNEIFKEMLNKILDDIHLDEANILKRKEETTAAVLAFFQEETEMQQNDSECYMNQLKEQLENSYKEVYQSYLKKRDEQYSVNRLKHLNTFRKALDTYKNLLKGSLAGSNVFSDEAFVKIHENASSEAFKLHEEEIKPITNNEQYSDFFEELKSKLDEESKTYYQENRNKREEQILDEKKEHEIIVEAAIKKYHETMKKFLDEEEFISVIDLRNTHSFAKEEAILLYKDESKNRKPEIASEYLEVLIERIRIQFQKYEKEINHKDKKQKAAYEGALSDSLGKYRQTMDKLLQGDLDSRAWLQDEHIGAKSKILKTFENSTRKSKNQDKYLKQLEESIDKIFEEDVVRKFGNIRVNEIENQLRIAKILKDCSSAYKNVMEKYISTGGFLDDASLETTSHDAKKTAISQHYGKEQELQEKIMDSIKKELDKQFEEFKRMNENKKMACENQCMKAFQGSLDHYKKSATELFQKLKNQNRPLDEGELNKLRLEALKYYEENAGEDNEIYRKHYQSLKENLENSHVIKMCPSYSTKN